jgi:hypothetical protein
MDTSMVTLITFGGGMRSIVRTPSVPVAGHLMQIRCDVTGWSRTSDVSNTCRPYSPHDRQTLRMRTLGLPISQH